MMTRLEVVSHHLCPEEYARASKNEFLGQNKCSQCQLSPTEVVNGNVCEGPDLKHSSNGNNCQHGKYDHNGQVVTREDGQVRKIVFRELSAQDYDRGFLDLLQQLTTVGTISREAFEKRVRQIDASPGQVVLVGEDAISHRIVASASLLVELKFIHGGSNAGHIEDVVVDARYRGQNLGRRLMEELLREAKHRGCYKTILDCSQEFVPFYEKCGFRKKECQMRFDHS